MVGATIARPLLRDQDRNVATAGAGSDGIAPVTTSVALVLHQALPLLGSRVVATTL